MVAKEIVKKLTSNGISFRDYRQRTLCGSDGLRKGSPLSLMLIQGGDDTCRYKKVPYPLKNGGSLTSLYFFPEFAKNRTWITRKMRFPAFLANNRLSTPVNQNSKGVVLNEREKTAIDAMRHPVICFTQVFSRIVRANHEKSLPRILHIQILWRFDFRNRKTVLEISQHLLSCFTQPFSQNGRAVRVKISRTSSIFRFFSRMISLATVEEGTVQPASYNSVFFRKTQGDGMKKVHPTAFRIQ